MKGYACKACTKRIAVMDGGDGFLCEACFADAVMAQDTCRFYAYLRGNPVVEMTDAGPVPVCYHGVEGLKLPPLPHSGWEWRKTKPVLAYAEGDG